MKKCILFIAGLGISMGLKAQLVTHDPMSFVQDTRDMIQEGLRHVENIREVKRSIEIARNTQSTIEDMKAFRQEIEDKLRFLGQLKDLKMTEIEQILEGYLCLELPSYSLDGGDSYFSEIRTYLQGGFCKDDAQRLRAFFDAQESLGEPIADIWALGRKNAEGLSKSYAKDQIIQERYYQLAILYENLSKDLMEKAEELRRLITRDGGELKMSDGERAAALASIQALSLRGIEMKEKSAQALQRASQGGRAQAFYKKMHKRSLEQNQANQTMSTILNLHTP